MRKIIKKIGLSVILSLISLTTFSAEIFSYKDKSGSVFQVCKDVNGFVVFSDGIKLGTFGTGHSKKDIQQQYNLKGNHVSSIKVSGNCPAKPLKHNL